IKESINNINQVQVKTQIIIIYMPNKKQKGWILSNPFTGSKLPDFIKNQQQRITRLNMELFTYVSGITL
ncbi:hypothetical protein, partial [Klebsiella variicola]|uniref:hypothetical protein n=1 Tax=Klebsiella variicola TaxID=244366 RepID=UPI000E39AA94